MLHFEDIKQKMADYCVYQDRCHWEVEKKLREFDLIVEARDEILLFLIQNNFLNEERFAISYTRGKFNQKKWGKRKIKQGLQKRFISDYLIQKALNQIVESEYLECLQQTAEKKWQNIKAPNFYQKKQKLIRYLMQRGFEWKDIEKVLEDISYI